MSLSCQCPFLARGWQQLDMFGMMGTLIDLRNVNSQCDFVCRTVVPDHLSKEKSQFTSSSSLLQSSLSVTTSMRHILQPRSQKTSSKGSSVLDRSSIRHDLLSSLCEGEGGNIK